MLIRTKFEIGLILLLLISFYFGRLFYNKFQEQKEQKEEVEQLFSKKQAEISLYKNKYNEIVSKNETITLENKTIKELVKNGNLSFLKEFESLKKNFKNLESAYQIKSKVEDSIKVKILPEEEEYVDEEGDTIEFEAQNWKYADKWSDFDVRQVAPDSVSFKYTVNVPLDGVVYWKRKWFLGKKKYFSEITSENPHVKIPEFLNIKVGRKK